MQLFKKKSLEVFQSLSVGLVVMALTGFGTTTFAENAETHHGRESEVKVMSYNIHHAEGIDGELNLERIARIIKDAETDIVGLQEVDNHWSARSDFQNQAKELAKQLGMYYTYGPNLDLEPSEEDGHRRQYGTAVLSKYPIIESKNHPLTKIGNTEQRGLLETTINVKGSFLHFYNTHLALTPAEREVQVKEMLEIADQKKGSKVIMGDLNATPESIEMKPMYDAYADAFAKTPEAYTYPAENPSKRIDYIFTSDDMEIDDADVISTPASDHLPLTAEIELER
jgi:endonuclease/exonuclease/phosphatase family metal-dependent hydrolase